MLVAQEAGQGGGSIWPTIILFAVLFGAMYLLFIRPQSKRRREAEQMQRQLGAGDDVITIGGLYGTVVETDEESVILEISEGVTARYARQAVARVVNSAAASSEAGETEEPSGEHDDAADAVEESVKSPVEETKRN